MKEKIILILPYILSIIACLLEVRLYYTVNPEMQKVSRPRAYLSIGVSIFIYAFFVPNHLLTKLISSLVLYFNIWFLIKERLKIHRFLIADSMIFIISFICVTVTKDFKIQIILYFAITFLIGSWFLHEIKIPEEFNVSSMTAKTINMLLISLNLAFSILMSVMQRG